jgi:hypothetical protein
MKIIADGDSWNSYPLPFSGGGLADHLAVVLDIDIENYAHPGDSTEETMGLKKRLKLEQYLPNSDILLFSGGGDDFVGDQLPIFLNDNKDGNINKAIDLDRLDAAMDLAIADYEDLFQLRDEIAPNCLIITHSYDFPVPEMIGNGVLWLGPWIKPGMDHCGWTNPKDAADITKLILLEFERRISLLSLPNHLHINFQGTLTTSDWGNEIHPNSSGWKKLANQIKLKLVHYLNK